MLLRRSLLTPHLKRVVRTQSPRIFRFALSSSFSSSYSSSSRGVVKSPSSTPATTITWDDDDNDDVIGEQKATAKEFVDKDVLLAEYCQKVYGHTAKNIAVTFASSGAMVASGLGLCAAGLVSPDAMVTLFSVSAIGGFIASLGGSVMLGATAPQYDNVYKDVMVNAKTRQRWANVVHAGFGVLMGPSLLLFGAQVAVPAFIGAGILTTGPVMASMYLPKGQLLKYGPAMYTGLLGLLGASIGGIWFPILHDISVYGGLALFTAYNAYDTHTMIRDYEDGNQDYIQHSTQYSMNFINIFIRLMEILTERKDY